MTEDTYSVVRLGNGKATHAKEYANWMQTFCGMDIRYYGQSATEAGTPVTCKRCRRSLASRPATNERARRTLAIGQEMPR